LIYLNELDHFVKRDLRIANYARYVDDFVLIGLTRGEALACRAKIVQFLAAQLGLELSKSSLHRVSKGLNFVGYRTWRSRRFVRKRSLYTYRRSVRRHQLESVVSSIGHAGR